MWIGPIMLYTERLDAIVPFYRDILGLPVRSYEPGHSCWLDTEPQLVLHAPEDEWFPAPYTPDRGGVVLWIAVDGDLDALARHLRGQHVRVEGPRGRDRDVLLVYDPEGRRLGLYRRSGR